MQIRRVSRCLAPLAALAAMSLAAPTAAQEDPLALRFAFGSQQMAGDMGDALDGAVDAEFSFAFPLGPVRAGAGANWASFDMDDQEASWNQLRFHLLAGYALRVTERLRPYAEARLTFRRLRPEDDRYFGAEEEELLRDFVTSGWGPEGVLGTEITINRALAVDVSGAVSAFSLSPDLSAEGLGPIDSGQTWRFHVGVAWFPLTSE